MCLLNNNWQMSDLVFVLAKLWEFGVGGLLLWAIRSLYCQSQNMVHIGGSKSNLVPVRVGFHLGYPSSMVFERTNEIMNTSC